MRSHPHTTQDGVLSRSTRGTCLKREGWGDGMRAFSNEWMSLAWLGCVALAACGVTVPGGLTLDVDPGTAPVAGRGGVAGIGGGVAGTRAGAAGRRGGIAGRQAVGGSGGAVWGGAAGAGGVIGGGTAGWSGTAGYWGGVAGGRSMAIDGDGDGYDARRGDCNDRDAAINPSAMDACCDGVDSDCDGRDSPAGATCKCTPPVIERDGDGDGFSVRGGDCDDTNAWISPGNAELCYDGVDNDCDRNVDESRDCALVDVDADGYPAGKDCNDYNSQVHPFAPENCLNGVDDNCDGVVDEGSAECNDDWDGDGFPTGSDCDDTDATVFPGAFEPCFDGRDGNCDGVSDFEDPWCLLTGDFDRDGFPAEKDCNDADARTFPGSPYEVCCDGNDYDCDGADGRSGVPCACGSDAFDRDGDGYSTGAAALDEPDCNDQDASIHPHAIEFCGDLRDNNCDGLIDSQDPSCRYVQ